MSSNEQEDLRYRMKLLVYNEKERCYDVPALGGYAAPSSGNTYFYAGAGEQSIAVTASMRANEKLDQVLDFMLTQEIPHFTLIRHGEGYLYEPWNWVIVVDEHNPGWGNTWKTSYAGITVNLGRLRNFRAMLRLIKEKQ